MTDAAPVPVLLHRLDPDLPVPGYAHPGDAGADLHARTDVTLGPGARALVATGVAIALPSGYAAFVHPRSGLATRHGVTTLTPPGRWTPATGARSTSTWSTSTPPRRSRCAAATGSPSSSSSEVSRVSFLEVDSLPGSHRGDTGHGASGGFGTHDRPADHAQHDRPKD